MQRSQSSPHKPSVERLRAAVREPHVESFCQSLRQHGYRPDTVSKYRTWVGHFMIWAQRSGLTAADFTDEKRALFERHISRCRCIRFRSRRTSGTRRSTLKAIVCFLKYLREKGIAPAPPPPPEPPPIITAFDEWMRDTRGTGEALLRCYRRYLTGLLQHIDCRVTRLRAEHVRAYLFERSHGQHPSTVRCIACALRMFLRFLVATGRCRSDLVAAVPAMSCWRPTALPEYLSSEEVERVIATCDVATASGRRDRAILLLLARLGLRAGDITALRLTDVDWPDRSIVVSGKNRYEVRLPLPDDAAEALRSYIDGGRPPTSSNRVFLCMAPPPRPIAPNGVSHITRRALDRAGIKSPSRAAHLLRHSAATEMLRRGVSVQGIGSVLRHLSIRSTAVYLKVDVAALQAIVQPWPVVAPC
jgi:site-specific recombinase XerD